MTASESTAAASTPAVCAPEILFRSVFNGCGLTIRHSLLVWRFPLCCVCGHCLSNHFAFQDSTVPASALMCHCPVLPISTANGHLLCQLHAPIQNGRLWRQSAAPCVLASACATGYTPQARRSGFICIACTWQLTVDEFEWTHVTDLQLPQSPPVFSSDAVSSQLQCSLLSFFSKQWWIADGPRVD